MSKLIDIPFIFTGLCPDWDDWTPNNPVKNATEAMDAAEQWLDVPQVSHSSLLKYKENNQYIRIQKQRNILIPLSVWSGETFSTQECIPVGCVPPGAVAVRGVSTRHPPGSRHPPRSRHPPVDRHMPVNILPCPKLRLRAVKIVIESYTWKKKIEFLRPGDQTTWTQISLYSSNGAPEVEKLICENKEPNKILK